MFKDIFDRISWTLLALIVCAALLLLGLNRERESGKSSAGLTRVLEREMAYRARVELIDKLYAPVEALRKGGNSQAALMRLDELNRKYPGEAHGHILQGEIQKEMGALDEAVASYVEGVKLNGDYLEDKGPLSRRREIQQLVEDGLKSIGVRAAANPGNRSLAASLHKVNYLKSRLAGGCE